MFWCEHDPGPGSFVNTTFSCLYRRDRTAAPLHKTLDNYSSLAESLHRRVAAPLPSVGPYEARNVDTAAPFDVCHRLCGRIYKQMVPSP